MTQINNGDDVSLLVYLKSIPARSGVPVSSSTTSEVESVSNAGSDTEEYEENAEVNISPADGHSHVCETYGIQNQIWTNIDQCTSKKRSMCVMSVDLKIKNNLRLFRTHTNNINKMLLCVNFAVFV